MQNQTQAETMLPISVSDDSECGSMKREDAFCGCDFAEEVPFGPEVVNALSKCGDIITEARASLNDVMVALQEIDTRSIDEKISYEDFEKFEDMMMEGVWGDLNRIADLLRELNKNIC